MRVALGLSNAPAEFQEYIENCLTDIRDKFAFPYLDDVLLYSDDFNSHVDHLRKVFQILRENDILVKEIKFKLFQKQINFLGRTITDKGYGIDIAYIKSVVDLFTIVSSSTGERRRILGLLGYYTRYVKGFSRIALPYFDLLKKDYIKNSSNILYALTSTHCQRQHQITLKNVNNSNNFTNIVIIPRLRSTLYTSCRCFKKRFMCKVASVQR